MSLKLGITNLLLYFRYLIVGFDEITPWQLMDNAKSDPKQTHKYISDLKSLKTISNSMN